MVLAFLPLDSIIFTWCKDMDIFCQAETVLKNLIIHKTDNFLVVHDGFPLAEGHLFLIPQFHLDCFLNLSDEFQNEYKSLVKSVVQFLTAEYKDPILFEHGIIAQTIPHAHLHFLPAHITIRPDIETISKPMVRAKIPYLYYGPHNNVTYFEVIKPIQPGFLHTTLAQKLKRPLIALQRAGDAALWTRNVKNKWNKWHSRG